jgi:hypothetical protein
MAIMKTEHQAVKVSGQVERTVKKPNEKQFTTFIDNFLKLPYYKYLLPHSEFTLAI